MSFSTASWVLNNEDSIPGIKRSYFLLLLPSYTTVNSSASLGLTPLVSNPRFPSSIFPAGHYIACVAKNGITYYFPINKKSGSDGTNYSHNNSTHATSVMLGDVYTLGCAVFKLNCHCEIRTLSPTIWRLNLSAKTVGDLSYAHDITIKATFTFKSKPMSEPSTEVIRTGTFSATCVGDLDFTGTNVITGTSDNRITKLSLSTIINNKETIIKEVENPNQGDIIDIPITISASRTLPIFILK